MNAGYRSRIRLLILSDGTFESAQKTGGVARALDQIHPVKIDRLAVRANPLMSRRFLKKLYDNQVINLKQMLRLGYNINPRYLPKTELVLSAGPSTQLANEIIARVARVPNIYCNSWDVIDLNKFTLVISPEQGEATPEIDPCLFVPNEYIFLDQGTPRARPTYSDQSPPKTAMMLIGGNTDRFVYREDEWMRLLEFMTRVYDEWGTRWVVGCFENTESSVAMALHQLQHTTPMIDDFCEFLDRHPDRMWNYFKQAEAAICTEDSLELMSHVVSAGIPLIGVAPDHHGFNTLETRFRDRLSRDNRIRFVLIRGLSLERLATGLKEIEPRGIVSNDVLVDYLRDRLPVLEDSVS